MTDENQQNPDAPKKPANPYLESVQANQPRMGTGGGRSESEQVNEPQEPSPEGKPVAEKPASQPEESPADKQEVQLSTESKSEPESKPAGETEKPVDKPEASQQEVQPEPEIKPTQDKDKEKGGEKAAANAEKTEAPKLAGAGKAKPEAGAKAAGAAPTKIGKEKKKPSKARFLVGCAGIALFLLVIFVVLMVLMMSRAGASNPVMRSLGLDPAGIQAFLLTVISASFGFLAFLFFVLMIIGIFRLLGAKKTDKAARGKGVRMTVFSLVPLVFIVFIWFALYTYISRIKPPPEQVLAEIVIVEPQDLSNLQAPVEITLSAENVAKNLNFSGISIEGMYWDLEGARTFETPAVQSEIVHLYNRRGVYNVGLRVDVSGEEEPRYYYQPIDISKAVFAADPPTGFAPLDVQFNASNLIVKGFKLQSLDWDFDGDGKYELEGPDNLAPRYRFEKIGVYNVRLRIVDQQNNVENYEREIEVTLSDVPLLTAVIDASPGPSGPIPLQIRFDGSRSNSLKGTIVRYDWDFGDGSDLQSGKSVSHVFEEPGYYMVELTVTEDSGKTTSNVFEVNAKAVSSVPEAKIRTNPGYDEGGNVLTGVLPFKVNFDASGSTDEDDDIIEYQWDFNGDGLADEQGKKIEYLFEEAGTYYVDLTVKDTEDQTSNASLKVIVEEPGVRAIINAVPFEGTAPLVVNFDGSASTAFNSNIVSYEWDFGDGSPTTIVGASVSHKYTNVGNYTVKLKVNTSLDEFADTTQVIYVREVPLKACFEPSRKEGSVPLSVTFDSKCSTGAISSFAWNFGDGIESDSRKPAHTFENAGDYTVTLEVTDDKNNVSTVTDVISVVEDGSSE